MQTLHIIGFGGHSKVVIDVAEQNRFAQMSIYDDNIEKNHLKYRHYTVYAPTPTDLEGDAIISIGSNRIRKRISGDYPRLKWKSLIHPSAYIAPDVKIGEGTVVMAGVIIQPGTVIGNHCIINTGALIDHDCIIGDYSHLAPGVSLAGTVTIGEGTLIGIGSCVVPNVCIGKWVIIGAGSVVIADIPNEVTAFGNPCRSKKM